VFDMPMEISRNYSNYAATSTNTAKDAGNTKESNVTTSTVELKTSTGQTKTEQIKTGYSNVNDYSKYLQSKYSYMNTGTTSMQGVPTTVSVSSAFLKKCMNDPIKAKYLEENLAALPDCASYAVSHAQGTLTSISYIIDANGNITAILSGTNDPDGKIARENAKRKAQEKKAAKEKAAKRRAEEERAATEVKTNTQSGGKDKVQEYYEKLCKKFPQINFNTNGGVLPSNNSKVTVNLSFDCLKKMANEPEFAKEIEWNLSGEAAANSMVYGWAQRDGVVLGGRTVTYDANGNRQSSCGGMRTANAGNENNNTNKTQKKYEEEEERWLKARNKRKEIEKLDKKRAEKKAEGEKAAKRQTERRAERNAAERNAAERRAERNAANEARIETGEYTISATGTDIKAITQSIVSAPLGTSAPTGASFDIKA